MLRAFNATRSEVGGPFQSVGEALNWALEHLPDLEGKKIDIEAVKQELIENGIAMVSEFQGKTLAEDVVIYDEERHQPDEDGYIDW